MNRRARRRFVVAIAAVAAGSALAVPLAQASEIDLACAGKGPHRANNEGTADCAAVPGKARVITGVLRDDAGKPAAGKVKVTFAAWIPRGEGSFSIEPQSSQTVSASASGQFSVPVKTDTKATVYFEAVADEKAGISPFKTEAEVSRRLEVKVKVLGGGKVKLTVKGGGSTSLKLYILDSSGYELPGVKPKKASKAGVAIFDLGSFRGQFSYYVDAGDLSDLFWEERSPSFHA